MKLKTFLFATMLALAGAAFGATPPPAASTGTGAHMGPCKTDPAKCQAEAAKFDQWCSANADKCTTLKAWAEKRREACEANKPKCEERREKMMERHKQFCDQNPDKLHCHAIVANHQPGDDDQTDDETPPPPK